MMKAKKKSGKRFLSWLLAAVMIIALMPANAFANDDNDYGGIDTYANQSNDNVEFWCTNSRVNVGGKTSASLNSLLSGKTQLVCTGIISAGGYSHKRLRFNRQALESNGSG